MRRRPIGQGRVPGPRSRRRGAASAEQGAGQQKFRDWLVACDNVGTCHAFAPASEGTGWVRITLAAGSDAAPAVAVGFWPENGEFGGPVIARVDDVAFETATVTGEDAPPVAIVSPDRARALVDAMAQGTAMALNAGGETVPISLTGAAASLLWIDEHQGRLGTTTALIRKGSRPAASVPAAPTRPRVVAAPPISQAGYGDQQGQTLPAAIEALPAVVQCRADTDFNPDLQAVISSARLDANTILWSVPCGAGAYNFSSAWFTATPTGPTRAASPSRRRRESLRTSWSTPPTTPRRASSTPSTRDAGLGDCGMADSWTWTGQAFVLRSASEMSECWGVPSEYWPSSWVSE